MIQEHTVAAVHPQVLITKNEVEKDPDQVEVIRRSAARNLAGTLGAEANLVVVAFFAPGAQKCEESGILAVAKIQKVAGNYD